MKGAHPEQRCGLHAMQRWHSLDSIGSTFAAVHPLHAKGW